MALRKANFELVQRDEEFGVESYELLDEVRNKWHVQLEGARIALAWRKNLKTDKYGQLTLGMCVLVHDLYKELAEYDFIIVLNREVWVDPTFTREQKMALVDHELCHADTAKCSDGEDKFDERGRRVYCIRPHDIQEFTAIVHRHGCYKRDLERFAEVIIKRSRNPIFSDTSLDPAMLQ